LRTFHALLVIAAVACGAPSSNDRFLASVPDRASFPPVADVLEHRCGTLDCHGTMARNLRLYGSEGLRLASDARPSSHPSTTDAEYDEDFASIVGLEPEVMSDVVRSGGADPERLTFYRKARGLEAHKAGTLVQAGDSQDTCIRSWLADHTDAVACVTAKASY
jgi:hypothetical protein